jgi:cytochrome c oxidase subunit 3
MSSVAVDSKKKVWGGGQSPFNLSYGKIMMWYFLMSDAFTFGAFLISYGTTRFLSSVTMVLAVHAGHCRDKAGVIKWMIWTIIGGIAFLSCQAWEWTHLFHHGGWWGSFRNGADAANLPHFFTHDVNPTLFAAEGADAAHKFFNFFFTITGFHGAHVASGVVLNIIILLNTINGTYEKRGHYEMVEKVGLYWHFVDLVWVFVFTCFYLL